jgi:hypothetical protein
MAEALRIAEYDGFVSLEVLGRQLPEDKEPKAAYLEEVDLTRELYFWNNEV